MDKKAVSPDSSTQITEKSKKSKKRKHKHRSKKKSKKVKSSSSSQDVESDNTKAGSKSSKNNESVTQLTEFLDDRTELHVQLFTIIPKKEVKELMPDILKKLSFKEVKKLCSEQLQSLSRRRLESIITGKEMASSEDESAEEPENNDELEPAQGQPEKGGQKRKIEDNETKGKRVREGKEGEKKEKDIIIFQEMITIPNQEEIDELVEGSSTMQEKTTGDPAQSGGPNVDEEAELKELEFRARALESLVRARERQMKTEHA